MSQVHDLARLPRSLIGLTNGHEGGHPFLADDFVRACITGRQPPVNAWVAARFTLPGLIAHESASTTASGSRSRTSVIARSNKSRSS